MISRRRSHVYYEYLEGSMEYNSFSVLKYRIVDKVRKFSLYKESYYYGEKTDLKNDLYEIVFYGLMALASVCKKDLSKDFMKNIIKNFYKDCRECTFM